MAHGLTCSEACGIFPDWGSNSCSLYWQADSLQLDHQGNPDMDHFLKSLLNLLQYCFCYIYIIYTFFFFFDSEACRIVAPRPGMESAPCIGRCSFKPVNCQGSLSLVSHFGTLLKLHFYHLIRVWIILMEVGFILSPSPISNSLPYFLQNIDHNV